MKNKHYFPDFLYSCLLIGITIFSSYSCKTPSQAINIMVSEDLEIRPLSPTGIINVGTFIYEDQRGYPARVASPEWIKEHLRKDKQVATRDMPGWSTDFTRNFHAALGATGISIPANVKNELKKFTKVTLVVVEATSSYLQDGEIEVTYWNQMLGGRIENDDELKSAIKTLVAHDTKGKTMEVVVETVTITKGSFTMDRESNVDITASADLKKLLSSTFQIDSDNVSNSSINITPDKPLVIGYLSIGLPMAELRSLVNKP